MSTATSALVNASEAQGALRRQLLDAAGAADGAADGARELAVWLASLRSFFDPKNHPWGESERDEVSARNFAPETRIVRQALRRCLLLGLSAGHAGTPGAQAQDDFDLAFADALSAEGVAGQADEAPPAELLRVLSDACALCDELAESGAVSLPAWAALGETLTRELGRESLRGRFEAETGVELLRRAQPELLRLAERVTPDALAGDVLAIFSLLARALEQLKFVESLLARDYPLKQSLPIFTLVHEQARTLVWVIESRALRGAEGRQEVYESLDSAAYALGMELNKVYGRELTGLAASGQAAAIYARVENSCGLLRDCCEQTALAVARLFEPEFDGARLFPSIGRRVEQSLRLREEMWALLELVRRAERERDRRPLAPLVERLKSFQQDGMKFLMYKDWESFERFVAELTAARGAVELGPVLHRFATYLEALFGQINMRAVLAERPFDFPPVAD